MTGEGAREGGAARAGLTRARTLRVLDLLQTKVQSVHIELVGGEDPVLDRLGTWTLYIPVLAVGYTLVLGAAVTAVQRKIGWAPSLLLFGVAHLGAGAWGILRGRRVGVVTRSSVLDPTIAPPGHPKATRGSNEDGAIPKLRPTPLPSPFPAARENQSKIPTQVFPLAESRP